MHRAVILFASLACAAASASPLTLQYCVLPVGAGMYRYTFTLTLDDNDATWAPGQNFNWIVFGDRAAGESPLADFEGVNPPPLPWLDDGFNYSSGMHNGPTLLDFGRRNDFYGWEPMALGDARTWEGYSSVNLTQGDLRWSNLVGTGARAELIVATRVACPDPFCAAADFNQDGSVDGQDVEPFYASWEVADPAADVNQDGGVDGSDIETFFKAWEAGGC